MNIRILMIDNHVDNPRRLQVVAGAPMVASEAGAHVAQASKQINLAGIAPQFQPAIRGEVLRQGAFFVQHDSHFTAQLFSDWASATWLISPASDR
jgi:hypothetical protein